MATDSVSAHWSVIEDWLRKHASGISASLRPGAGDDALARLQGELGAALPADLRASLRRHDGQKDLADGLFPFSGKLGPEPSFRLLSVEEIGAEWRMMKELLDGGNFQQPGVPDRGIAAAWWHSGWIPVAGNGGGDYFCVDLAPASGGNAGQVLLFAHDNAKRPRAADSFEAWLGRLAEGLRSGKYEYSEEDGIVASE